MHKRQVIMEWLFQFVGLLSIIFIVLVIFFLGKNLIYTSYPALWQTQILLDIKDPNLKPEKNLSFALEKIGLSAYSNEIFSRSALYEIRQAKKSQIWVPVKAKFQANYYDKQIPPELNQLLLQLNHNAILKTKFNWKFFVNNDSRYAEIAGIGASIKGTSLLIWAAWLISIPLAFIIAIYLEEFARHNFIVALMDIIVANLLATPSVILGILSLTIFTFEKSTPLLGGATLSLIMLPSLIVILRQALQSFPSNIKEAANALGASKIHILCEHILPYCFPQILRGILVTTSRIIGETAPLLIVGMVAFVPTLPVNWSSPSTTLSTIIYLWSEAPEPEFIHRVAATSLSLLLIVTALNLFANIIVRSK